MISREEIEKLAALSRLSLTPSETEAMRTDIDSILGHIAQIEQATSKERESSVAGNVHNVMREDGPAHESGIHTETLLAAAPRREGNYIKVKKIL